jgi:hypothetical protein
MPLLQLLNQPGVALLLLLYQHQYQLYILVACHFNTVAVPAAAVAAGG